MPNYIKERVLIFLRQRMKGFPSHRHLLKEFQRIISQERIKTQMGTLGYEKKVIKKVVLFII